METVNEESIVKNTISNNQCNQERNTRLDMLSKVHGVKRLSLSRYSMTGLPQPQTPASCPNRSPSSCLNISINEPISAIETNKILTFREVDYPTLENSRKISQITQSSSSLTSLTSTNRPTLSLLGILAAKRITRKFLSTLTDAKQQRRLSTFTSFSPASYNLINYLPTFQLGPKEVFNISGIQPRIEQLIQLRIDSLPRNYESYKVSRLCITLTNEIKAMLKAHGEDRYRYLVFCIVMQNCKQMALFTSRVLWDMNNDRTFCVTYTNATYCISVNCFAVYKE
ncbi:tctex1 domain-containing 1-like [Schistosoma japonicum]|nr:tctex1 domain-containing 1-like [Schistosoma japonicum]